MQHDKQIDAQLKHTVRDLGELLGQPTKYLVFSGLLIFREFLNPYFIPKISIKDSKTTPLY